MSALALVTVAALYVEADGCYAGRPGVEIWPVERDARRYAGPHPVVAHPPCQRWGKMWAGQPAHIARTGERKTKGADGGCFAAALAAVRRWGGVLEHPEHSAAWSHFGLHHPPRAGGWVVADFEGGWTCCVEQGRYGHRARKPTWLYACRAPLPSLRWGRSEPVFPPEALARYGIDYCRRAGELAFLGGGASRGVRNGTPPEFGDLLIAMARAASAADARALCERDAAGA
jgi:hypothetical protein